MPWFPSWRKANRSFRNNSRGCPGKCRGSPDFKVIIMTYEEVLNGIHSRRAFSTGGPTLDRIRRLMEALGNPQESFRTVHVAGTNGKGSCCALVDGALRECGYQTGLFTSPYLKDFRERIRLDGEMISKEMLISCYETVMAAENHLEQQGCEPVNEFELVTAIGFLAFAHSGMEYVVLEVGLGGRTDPTNLIKTPAVAVIMPISLDHVAILGDTVAKIAGEKAGIIKEGCPVVVAPQTADALEVISHMAGEKQAPLYQTEPVSKAVQEKQGSSFFVGSQPLSIRLLGEHQMENAATAWQVCQVLGLPRDKTIAAFAKTPWPGRLQFFEGEPEILVDAGHNQAGVTALVHTLDTLFSGRSIIAIMAMMGDKDHEFCIPAVARRAKELIATTVGLPRSLSTQTLAQEAENYCPIQVAPSVKEALNMAKERAEQDDLILVCGSVYAAGDALLAIEGE